MAVLVMFACAGLVLVALGIYGVLAYTVSQQTREFAIRMALGGERRHVWRHVYTSGMKLLGGGLALGLGAGLATNRVVATQVSNASPHDPLTISAVAFVVCAIGLLACWIPARRAIRVDPIVALRHE